MLKYVLQIITFIFLFVIQVSFFSASPFLRENFNIILIALIYFLQAFDIKQGLILGVVLGLILDIFSAYPFGIMLISLIITLIVTTILLSNVFTNRSLLSFLLLIVIGVSILYVLIWIETTIFSFFSESVTPLPFLEMARHLVLQLIINTTLGLAVWTVLQLILGLIRSRFIITKSSPS